MELRGTWITLALAAVVTIACGPTTGGQGEAADGGTGSTSETPTASSTGPGWSIEDLRPWFGEYHIEGSLNPPLDVEWPDGAALQNFELREDGTFVHEFWSCQVDEPEQQTFAWTQTGPTSIRVHDWEGGAYLRINEPSLDLSMREGCPTLEPDTDGTSVLVGGRACWVTRDCDDTGHIARNVVEITLCDGAPAACAP